MSPAIYKQIIRSYFSKDTNVYVRMPSQKVVLNKARTIGHVCCVCNHEINGLYVRCEYDFSLLLSLHRVKKCPITAHPNCVWKDQNAFKFSIELTVRFALFLHA